MIDNNKYIIIYNNDSDKEFMIHIIKNQTPNCFTLKNEDIESEGIIYKLNEIIEENESVYFVHFGNPDIGVIEKIDGLRIEKTKKIKHINFYYVVKSFIEKIDLKNEINFENQILFDTDNRETVLICMNYYSPFGGVETWCETMKEELNKKGIRTLIFYSIESNIASYTLEKDNIKFYYNENDFLESIKIFNEIIKKILPVTFIFNQDFKTTYYACILKKYYKENLNNVSVLHGFTIYNMEISIPFEKSIDSIFCVSSEIKNYVLWRLKHRAKDIYFRVHPIRSEVKTLERSYSMEGKPIILAYGSRLEMSEKKSLDTIELIKKLEELNVNYKLRIAGTGDCFDEINQYIFNNNLTSKVVMYGLLQKEEMENFWLKSDVHLNFSNYEGLSISLLEAMNFGSVPVVTGVGGIRDDVLADCNDCSYMVQVGDVNTMALGIKELDDDRERLKVMGQKARKRFEKISNKEEYVDYFINNVIRKNRKL